MVESVTQKKVWGPSKVGSSRADDPSHYAGTAHGTVEYLCHGLLRGVGDEPPNGAYGQSDHGDHTLHAKLPARRRSLQEAGSRRKKKRHTSAKCTWGKMGNHEISASFRSLLISARGLRKSKYAYDALFWSFRCGFMRKSRTSSSRSSDSSFPLDQSVCYQDTAGKICSKNLFSNHVRDRKYHFQSGRGRIFLSEKVRSAHKFENAADP